MKYIMSMAYKIYVFDYTAFKSEIAGMLYRALAEDELDELNAFIEQKLPLLTNPNTGQPLDTTWRKALKPRVVNDFADLAVTKYYNPADCTLIPGWLDLDNVLRSIQDDLGSLILGSPFGPISNTFDPHNTGAYFQTPSETKRTQALLEMLSEQQRDKFILNASVMTDLTSIISLLTKAVAAGKGVYVTL